jgi:hypothetical protein
MAEPELHAAVWNALCALPKPVTHEAARLCADAVITQAGSGQNVQFLKWWDTNGETVLRRLNG